VTVVLDLAEKLADTRACASGSCQALEEQK